MKRYSAKILTLLYRDFLNANKQLRSKLSQPHAKRVFAMCLKNLMYFLPSYLSALTFNPQRYAVENLEDEEEDFELEFQSLIVQILSLVSTLISLYPKVIFKDLKNLTPCLLLIMFMYSLKSPFEQEKNYREDKNLFLADFLMDTSVDYQSQVAVRSTVIDLLDEAFQHPEFNKQVFEQVIGMLATGTYSLNGASLLPS
jgi:hypothetical protein